MVILEPLDSIQIRPMTEQNDATAKDDPTPVLIGTKTMEGRRRIAGVGAELEQR